MAPYLLVPRQEHRQVHLPVRTHTVESWDAEKRMATELSRLRSKVKRLAEDIRGGAIPVRNAHSAPAFPTEPDRRARAVRIRGDDPDAS